ncbi:MAG: cupredoxin domain-containing protein [Actinomycetota bacterium]|nr:cupredoxin domain-containing protein [Actinomycetota bacterium]
MAITTYERPRRDHHPLAGLALLVGLALFAAGVVFGVTAGVGAIWSSVTSLPASAPASASAAGSSGASGAGGTAAGGAASTVSVVIRNVPTPEGPEPAFVGPSGVGSATLFTAKVGTTLKVTVKNENSMPHTFTSPTLNLSVTIAPDATTTFTVTAKTAGTFSYWCNIPCGGWVMSHNGYMRGDVTVVA